MRLNMMKTAMIMMMKMTTMIMLMIMIMRTTTTMATMVMVMIMIMMMSTTTTMNMPSIMMGKKREEEEKPEKKIQVQHRSPVTRGIGVAAAAATGGTARTAVPGGVANQFKPTSLYIGDLNINVTDTQLYQLFNQAGQVISVRICRGFSTRRSLGYGFVNYSNPQDAARAMEMLDFTPVNGTSIRVKRSHRDPNSPKNKQLIYLSGIWTSQSTSKLYMTPFQALATFLLAR